ncbi:hypothetical protein N8865_02970 [Francisellaceae bacterium]|nr:hypothetical protein [Francisellaceae bacterium]
MDLSKRSSEVREVKALNKLNYEQPTIVLLNDTNLSNGQTTQNFEAFPYAPGTPNS